MAGATSYIDAGGSGGEGEGTHPSAFAEQFRKAMIFTAKPLEGKNAVYLGPRKVDDSPQAVFHYGDGKYVVQFHYIKDGKANERCGVSSSETLPEDKKKPLFMDPTDIMSNVG